MWVWLVLLALVLLIVLKLWPKAIFFVLAVVLLLGGGIYAWLDYQQGELARVRLEASYDPALCPSDRPVRVVITNTSDKTLERVLFTLHAEVPGYSSTVTPYTYKQNRSDKILRPGESYAACYPEPVMSRQRGLRFSPAGLHWSANVDSAYFQ